MPLTNYLTIEKVRQIREQINGGSVLAKGEGGNYDPELASGNYEITLDTAVTAISYKVYIKAANDSEWKNVDSDGYEINNTTLTITRGWMSENYAAGVSGSEVQIVSESGGFPDYIRLNTENTWNSQNTAIYVPLNQEILDAGTFTSEGTKTINLSDFIGINNYVGIGSNAKITFDIQLSNELDPSHDSAAKAANNPITTQTGSWAVGTGYYGFAGPFYWNVQEAIINERNLDAADATFVFTETTNGYTVSFASDSQGQPFAEVDFNVGAGTGGREGWFDGIQQRPTSVTLPSVAKAIIGTTPRLSGDDNEYVIFSTTSTGAGYLGNSTDALTLDAYTGILED